MITDFINEKHQHKETETSNKKENMCYAIKLNQSSKYTKLVFSFFFFQVDNSNLEIIFSLKF